MQWRDHGHNFMSEALLYHCTLFSSPRRPEPIFTVHNIVRVAQQRAHLADKQRVSPQGPEGLTPERVEFCVVESTPQLFSLHALNRTHLIFVPLVNLRGASV